MKNVLLLVGGKSHSGKGTFSKNLETFLSNRNANIIRCSLSTYIRQITKDDFYWNGVDTSESRKFMGEVYRLGTEIYPYHMARRVWERDISPKLSNSNNIIIVESFRELNNYTYFKLLQDKKEINQIITINIIRPNFSDISEEQTEHISETDLDNFDFDYTILNNETMEELIDITKMFTDILIQDLDLDNIPKADKFEIGDKVKIVKINNLSKASHLSAYVGMEGIIYSYINMDNTNTDIRYKVLFPQDITSYFRPSELQKVGEE